jgi:hypothetical protein
MAEACQIITIGSDIATRAGFPGVSGHTATEAGVAGSTVSVRPNQVDYPRPADQRAGVRLATSDSVRPFNPGSTA